MTLGNLTVSRNSDTFLLAESLGEEDIQDIVRFPGILAPLNDTEVSGRPDYFCGVCVVHSQTREDTTYDSLVSHGFFWFGFGPNTPQADQWQHYNYS